MTANIFSILNIGKSGLLNHQLGIEVTGHNIANVQTKGYSRQEVNLEASRPRQVGLGLLGTGVRTRSITRDFDQFLFNQILGEGSINGNFRIRKEAFDKLEILFNESTGRSLNEELGLFFSSFDDLATNPSGQAERSTVINTGESLVANLNLLGDSLFQERLNADLIVEDEVTQINALLDEIVELNIQIHASEPLDTPANDLRDRRDILVKDISEKLDINIIDDNSNQIRMTLTDGTPLILGQKAFKLSTAANGDNRGFKDVFIDDGGSGTVNVTSRIQGGELRGYLDVRDVETVSLIDQVDRLTATLVQEVNRVHRQGFGSDGSTGLDFFTPLTPTVHASVLNAGTAVVSMTNASPTTVSTDKYQIQFTGAGSFDLVNLTTGASSGSFTFTAGSTFNLIGGMAVTITGSAAAGDTVNFSVSEDAATKVSVSSVILNDTRKVAAGKFGTTDGENALALSNVQNRLVFDGNGYRSGSGTVTLDEFYNSIVSSVGVDARSANSIVEQQDGVMLQLETRRESISGVSIDEEMINLIKFQQAYQASARLLNVVQDMFDILQDRI